MKCFIAGVVATYLARLAFGLTGALVCIAFAAGGLVASSVTLRRHDVDGRTIRVLTVYTPRHRYVWTFG